MNEEHDQFLKDQKTNQVDLTKEQIKSLNKVYDHPWIAIHREVERELSLERERRKIKDIIERQESNNDKYDTEHLQVFQQHREKQEI